MSLTECEKVQLAMMVESSGEEPAIPAEQLASHLASCEDCLSQAAELSNLDQLFQRQARSEQDVNLWPAIQQQIGEQTRSVNWQPFAVVTPLLVSYRLIEMLGEQPLAPVFSLVPLALMLGLFALIKENPFRINTELTMER